MPHMCKNVRVLVGMLQSPVDNWAWVTDRYAQSVQPAPSTCEEQQMPDIPGAFFSYSWKDYR